ncbi:MAG: hypothetical protein ACRDGU_09720 [Actinomycetota bacterium]
MLKFRIPTEDGRGAIRFVGMGTMDIARYLAYDKDRVILGHRQLQFTGKIAATSGRSGSALGYSPCHLGSFAAVDLPMGEDYG